MTLHAVKMGIYSLVLTNYYGFKLRNVVDQAEKKKLRLQYSKTLLGKLKISVEVKNKERLKDGKYLILSNHRGIIDPLILEIALEKTNIFGVWISKKELYNSPFFGLFVRKAGSVLLDREQSQMSGFFAETKEAVKAGASVFIFPEGTRNKGKEKLLPFKEGFRIIALKNRLPILPVYIRTQTHEALGNALANKSLEQTVTIEIGELIDCKERGNIQEIYEGMFGL